MDNADSRYDVEPWNQVPNEYNAPAGTWEEAAIRQATVTTTLDRKSVQALVRPSLPSVLPPGTQVMHMPPYTIDDAVNASRSLEDRRAYYSGGPAGYTGSTRNESGAL